MGVIGFLGGMKSNEITVHASSIWRGEAIDFISQEKVFVWTHNLKFSWFVVDLGENNVVKPYGYIMRYGSSGNKVPPRNWVFQGTNNPNALVSKLLSQIQFFFKHHKKKFLKIKKKKKNKINIKEPYDNEDWVTIKWHKNDTSIDSAFGIGYWKIDYSKKQNNSSKYFRYFRILQVGFNKMPSNAQWNQVLVVSGFELWGTLIRKIPKKFPSLPQLQVIQPPSDPSIFQKQFVYRYDYDTNGIIYNIRKKPIEVYASEMWRGNAKDFISRSKIPVWTTNKINSWFE